MTGSVYDGVFRKSLEVHCRNCGQAELGLPDNHRKAARELRYLGWAMRDGRWCCRWCIPDLSRGTKFPSPDTLAEIEGLTV